MIAWIEDIAHATGIDKAIVHPITGGHRVFERDGRVSPEALGELESAFHAIGADRLVHLTTGGARVVKPDGTFDAVGAINVAKNLADMLVDPETTLVARGTAMVFKEMVNAALDGLTHVNAEVGHTAKEVKQIKDKINGLQSLLEKIEKFAASPKTEWAMLPDIATAVMNQLHDARAF